MKTAVEWLFEKLWNTDRDKFTWYAILKQAKEMEKEQIMDAFNGEPHCDGDGDRYYNETFKSE